MTSDYRERPANRPGLLRRFARRARNRAVGTFDTVTGLQPRRQFEEFTDAVTTTVMAVYQDQIQLKKRVEGLESVNRDLGHIRRIRLVAIALGAGTLSALVIGAIALARTF